MLSPAPGVHITPWSDRRSSFAKRFSLVRNSPSARSHGFWCSVTIVLVTRPDRGLKRVLHRAGVNIMIPSESECGGIAGPAVKRIEL